MEEVDSHLLFALHTTAVNMYVDITWNGHCSVDSLAYLRGYGG